MQVNEGEQHRLAVLVQAVKQLAWNGGELVGYLCLHVEKIGPEMRWRTWKLRRKSGPDIYYSSTCFPRQVFDYLLYRRYKKFLEIPNFSGLPIDKYSLVEKSSGRKQLRA